MQLNNLALCLILLFLVELISFVVSIFKKYRYRKLVEAKKSYYTKLTFLMNNHRRYRKIISELYLSLNKSDKILRRILFKALSMDFSKALSFIEKRLYCSPFKDIHQYIKDDISNHRYTPNLTEKERADFYNSFNEWLDSSKVIEQHLCKLRIRFIIEKYLVLLLQGALYLYIRNEESLFIFIVVDAIGVILGIVLDSECSAVDGEILDGNLAFARKRKALNPAKGLKELFQIIVGLGLILNISMIAVQALEQVI